MADVLEDAMRKHVYLPADMLANQGVSSGDILALPARSGVAAVCGEIAQLASEHYDEAERLMSRCEKSKVRPALIMKNVYRTIFLRVMDRGWYNLDESVSLSRFEKSVLVVKSALLSH